MEAQVSLTKLGTTENTEDTEFGFKPFGVFGAFGGSKEFFRSSQIQEQV